MSSFEHSDGHTARRCFVCSSRAVHQRDGATWNRLWFVAYLWVYTMALGLILALKPDLARHLEQAIVPARSPALLLLVPALTFAAYRLVLLPHFPSTHTLNPVTATGR